MTSAPEADKTPRVHPSELPEELPVPDVSPELRSRMVSLWHEGKTLRGIGAVVNHSAVHVKAVLNDAGVDTSHRPQDTRARDQRIVELYTREEHPLNVREIAAETRLAYNTVRKVLGDNGVLRARGGAAGRPRKNAAERVSDRMPIPYRPGERTRKRMEEAATRDQIPLQELIDRAVSAYLDGKLD